MFTMPIIEYMIARSSILRAKRKFLTFTEFLSQTLIAC